MRRWIFFQNPSGNKEVIYKKRSVEYIQKVVFFIQSAPWERKKTL
jgi:hypothetical protein